MSNYSLVKLKDLIINITDNRGKTPPLVESGIELIETPSLRGDNKYVDFSKINKYVSQETYETWFRSGHPKNGDILITLVGTIGKVCIFKDNRGCIAQNIVALEFNEYCNSEFMYYYLSSPIMQNQISFLNRQSAQPNLKVPDFINLAVSLPPLKEQQKIAEILSSVDAAIEKTEQVIAKIEEVKKGLMQQLLTRGIGHTEFKQTEIGEIPIEWTIKKLSEIANVTGGKRLPKGKSLTNKNTGYPYIRVSDMTPNGLSSENILYIPTDCVEDIKRYTINKDDLYISVAGTLGLVGKVPESLDGANLTENADRISNISCYIDYLLWVLRSEQIQKIITAQKTTSAQPKLALGRIKDFIIPIPSFSEQVRISTILENQNIKINIEKEKLEKLESIKQGLMQQLLTGQVRVKVD